MGNYRAVIADQEENKTSCVDKEANIERDILSTEEWLQLGRFTQRFAALFYCVLALQAVV